MQNEIRGINIKQLLWKIILGWKKVLLLGIVFSVLLVSYKYMKDKSNSGNNGSVESTISQEEIKKLDDIISKYARLSYLEEYYNDSLVMKLNPKQYNLLEIQYYIDSEYTFDFDNENEKDYTSSLVSAYSAYVTGGNFTELLKNEMNFNTSIQSVKELIQVVDDKEGATIKLVVSIPNDCDSKKLEETIDKIVNAKKTEMNEIGKHDLRKLNSSVNVGYSDVLERKIFDVSSNIVLARSGVEASKTTLTVAQKDYLYENLPYEKYREEFVTNIGTNTTANVAPQISKKFMVVGFILGVFVSCALYLVREVLSNKVQNPDDIEIVYGVRKLGIISREDKKKRLFIDKILLDIKNADTRMMTKEDKEAYVVSNIEIICDKNQLNSVAFIQSMGRQEEAQELKDLAAALEKKGISCKILDNITNDGEQLKTVVADGNAVIVGKLNRTSYAKLEQEIRLLKQYNINVLGSVIVE